MQSKTSKRLNFLVAFLTISMVGTTMASEIQKPKDSAEHTQRRLLEIFDQSDEHQLASDPLGAIARGDSSFADQFGDFGAPAYFAWQEAQSSEVSRQLAEIDRSQLSETDRVSYDAFSLPTRPRTPRFRTRRRQDPARAESRSAFWLSHLVSRDVDRENRLCRLQRFRTIKTVWNGLEGSRSTFTAPVSS